MSAQMGRGARGWQGAASDWVTERAPQIENGKGMAFPVFGFLCVVDQPKIAFSVAEGRITASTLAGSAW